MTKTAAARSRRRHRTPQSLGEYLAGPPPVSQRQLAAAADCNQSMISMLVRGTRVPSARLAVVLHSITGVPLKLLLAPKIVPPAVRRRPPSRGSSEGRHVSP